MGFILIVDRPTADEMMARLTPMQVGAWDIGVIEHRREAETEKDQVEIDFE